MYKNRIQSERPTHSGLNLAGPYRGSCLHLFTVPSVNVRVGQSGAGHRSVGRGRWVWPLRLNQILK